MFRGTVGVSQEENIARESWVEKHKMADFYDKYRCEMGEKQARRNFIKNYRFVQRVNSMGVCRLATNVVADQDIALRCDYEDRRSRSVWYEEKETGSGGQEGSVDPIKIRSFTVPSDEVLPESFDWREKGAVTRVKNQENCEACWAFAVTACLESKLFLTTGRLVTLSEQSILDGVRPMYEHALPNSTRHACAFVIENGGLEEDRLYPYEACRSSTRKTGIQKVQGTEVDSVVKVPSGNEKALMHALVKYGPIYVNVRVPCQYAVFYRSGIIDPSFRDTFSYQVEHCVLVVGYGVDEIRGLSYPYWLLKNWSGPGWGDGGYFKVKRDSWDRCGVTRNVEFPLLKSQVEEFEENERKNNENIRRGLFSRLFSRLAG